MPYCFGNCSLSVTTRSWRGLKYFLKSLERTLLTQ
uniref:Uncharacterized protein n=1 Tax=Anguilla anguilla TaxID=7936 RepID=A0A0E9VWW8_ANGAN